MKITVLHSKDALDPPVDPLLDQLDAALAQNGHTTRRLAVDDRVAPDRVDRPPDPVRLGWVIWRYLAFSASRRGRGL